MTIGKNEKWGTVVSCPPGLPLFSSSRSLSVFLTQHSELLQSSSPFECRLYARNFHTLLGLKRKRSEQCLRIPIDVVRVEGAKCGARFSFVAIDTILLTTRFPFGEYLLLTNSGFWWGRRFAPRAHPNDGKMDVVEIDENMTFRQRFLGFRRAKWSTHLPHPQIAYEQRVTVDWRGGERRLWIDGRRLPRVSELYAQVLPDALVLYV